MVTLALTIPETGAAEDHLIGSYWCDAAAYVAGGRMIWLGGNSTAVPVAALVWLGWRAGHVAEQLDAPLARPVWAWRDDGDEHARAVERLSRGETYALVIQTDDVVFVLAATPVTGEGEPWPGA